MFYLVLIRFRFAKFNKLSRIIDRNDVLIIESLIVDTFSLEQESTLQVLEFSKILLLTITNFIAIVNMLAFESLIYIASQILAIFFVVIILRIAHTLMS